MTEKAHWMTVGTTYEAQAEAREARAELGASLDEEDAYERSQAACLKTPEHWAQYRAYVQSSRVA